MSMGEAYLSIIFGGQLFKASYEEQKLENHLMARCLEEGATLTTPLIPWTTSGAFCLRFSAFRRWRTRRERSLTTPIHSCPLSSRKWALEYFGRS